MNLLTLDFGTMAGMTDDHFIASVEPLLMTPLEKELFKRFAECSLGSDMLATLYENGFDSGSLQNLLDAPDCPVKDVLDEPIDDALYLSDMFATETEGREVAERLRKTLIELQGKLK